MAAATDHPLYPETASDRWWAGYSAHSRGDVRPADVEAARGWDPRDAGLAKRALRPTEAKS